MATIVLWATILIFLAVLAVGFFAGFRRGLKRSVVHIVFLLASLVIAIFLTKVISNALLSIKIPYDGETMTLSQVIISALSSVIDLSAYEILCDFVTQLPLAIIAPFTYISMALVLYAVFEVIYKIFARIVFGKKKEDFQNNKPRKWWGAALGAVEAVVFMFFILLPINSLTGLYSSLATTQTSAEEVSETDDSDLLTVSELINEYVPTEVTDAVVAYNNSILGWLSGIGGLDDALFDYLSEISVNGEKIQIREEVVLIADIYDDFVAIYNNFVAENYSALSASELKESAEKFLDGGLFKGVLADTVTSFVVDYDTAENSFGLPDVLCDVIDSLKETFSESDFDSVTYLGDDILAALNAVDAAFESNLIEDFVEISELNATNLMSYISNNSDAVKTVADNVLSINILKESLPALCSYGSDLLADYFEEDNTQNLTIALNSNLTDVSGMLDDALEAIDMILSLSDEVDLSALMGGDVSSAISSDTDVNLVFDNLGSSLDILRNLEIFVIEEGETETVYVFDNILSVMGVKILGDDVTWEDYTGSDVNQDGTVTLDSYTKFFDFLKTPVENAQTLGFFDSDSLDFDTILDNLLDCLTTNENFLSETIMPFYDLSVLSLKETVFDKVVDILSENVSMLDISTDESNEYADWQSQFEEIGEILNLLNRGEVGEDSLTYIKYVLSDGYSMETLLSSMKDATYEGSQSDLNAVLTKIFSSSFTESLAVDIFEQIDSEIVNITGVTPTTFDYTESADNSEMLSVLKTNVADVVAVIEEILAYTQADDFDADNLDFSTVGAILDSMRVEAYQDNDGDPTYGVFKEIFSNLIWYMTGDVIHSEDNEKYSGHTAYEQTAGDKAYEDVRDYLGTSGTGYYSISYEQQLAEIADVIDFANALEELDITTGMTLSEESDVSDLISNFKSALESSATDTDAQIALVENLTTLLENSKESLIEDYSSYSDALTEAITTNFSGDLQQSVLALFGLGD